MCGIIGAFSSGRPLDDLAVSSLDLDRMRHRGPDGQGWFVEPGAVMGFRRLAIIDVAGGSQPLYNEDESVVSVVNGEIYNHHQLRSVMKKRHRFRTRVDAEVLPHLFEEHGLDFVEHLDGMFALALFDRRTRTVVLGRDRAGKKPLYYEYRNGVLRWSSELKPLLGERRPPVCREALNDYLRFGYVPAPLTMLEGVRKLPAGHLLVAHDGSAPRLITYWSLCFARDDGQVLSVAERDDWARQLSGRLEASVCKRLESEVPMAFLLSGGIDSSAVLACGAASVDPSRRRAFTVGFSDETIDETLAAGEVASRYGVEHVVVDLPQHRMESLASIVAAVEEPVSTDALLPTYEVFASLAQSRITTVLSGEGADELLAGYRKFRYTAPWMLPKEPQYSRPLQRYLAHEEFSFTDDMERAELMGWRDESDRFSEVEREAAELDPLSQMLLLEARLRLPDRINLRLDRLSMAHSIEARAPFMDHRLMEFCATIPRSLLLDRDTEKVVLRCAMRDRLPTSVVQGRKRPFRAPERWWTESPAVDNVLGVCTVVEAGLVRPAQVAALLALAHNGGDRSVHEKLYCLYVLHAWHGSFYRCNVAQPVPEAGGFVRVC